MDKKQHNFSELEKKKGIFALDPEQFKDKKSLIEDEFTELVVSKSNDFRGCNYDERTKWLKANGYELTRENLLNPNLPTRQQS